VAKEKDFSRGLSSQEAEERLKQYGPNTIESKSSGTFVLLVKKLTSPLLLLLITVAIVSFFVGEQTNALIILVMVFISIFLDFISSYRSEKSVKELLEKIAITATVLRDRKKQEIRFGFLVPGDVVFLSAGDVVPADCTVIESKDLHINQATLTGEAFPVEKKPGNPSDIEKIASDKSNLVLMGTNVVTGFATVLVNKTGKDTEFGKIAERLERAETETTFDKQLKSFSFLILKVTFLMVSFAFIVLAYRMHDWLNPLLFALAIAIGLTPELLPVIFSISLSRGSMIMAQKSVIVRHSAAIQNIGSMNVFCTDKTGTLTEGRIVLVKYVDLLGDDSRDVLLYAYLNSIYHTGVDNPLDQAIRDFRVKESKGFKKVEEIPFDFTRKRQSVVLSHNGQEILVTKGAPEEIFKVCDYYLKKGKRSVFNSTAKKEAKKTFENLSKEGFRILGVSVRYDKKSQKKFEVKDEKNMIFLGFAVFLDPAKSTAKGAVKDLEKLGIEIKILTGDNEFVTQKICQDIALDVRGTLLGTKIDRLNDKEIRDLLPKTTIFARVNPEQKERIILLLKQVGNAVGYMGDGINDAPSLKVADVGISVANAVDVAKDTADIILLKKSLLVLKDGIIEGRKTYRNALKYILMGLSSNFGNMFSMTGASLFLPFLPMLPTQVLFNNLIYDISQLSIATDSVDAEDILKPTKWRIEFVKRYMIVFGWASSLFDFMTFGLMYFGLIYFYPHLSAAVFEGRFQTGWFIESIATQTFVIYIIRTRKIPFLQSRPSLALFLNTSLAVIFAWITPYIFIGHYLGLQPLSAFFLSIIATMVIAYLVLVQFIKGWFFRKYTNI